MVLNAEENIDIVRSAVAVGDAAGRFQKLNEDEQDGYLRVRGFGIYRRQEPLNWPNALNVQNVFETLSNSVTATTSTSRSFNWRVQCSNCNGFVIGNRNTQHHCAQQGDEFVDQERLNLRRIMYPHDLLLLGLLDVNSANIPQLIRNVREILEINNFQENFNVGNLNDLAAREVYGTTHTNNCHWYFMAVDVWISVSGNVHGFNPPRFNDIGDHISDRWPFDYGSTLTMYENHFNNSTDYVLSEGICSVNAEVCNYYCVILPTTASFRNRRPLPRNQQNKCQAVANRRTDVFGGPNAPKRQVR